MRLAVVLLALMLNGCIAFDGAGAARWKSVPSHQCGVTYCVGRSGRINPATDCRCTHGAPIGDIR